MRWLAFMAIGVWLATSNALAQDATNAAPATATSESSALAEGEEKDWSFSLSAYTYIVPDSRDYAQPTFTADRGRLHLEARYNYEGLDTGSVWAGCNFNLGEKLSLEITPMLGAVFGETTGVAPGYKYTLSCWKLQLYSEGEYLFDTDDSSESFFYTWSELTISPVEDFRIGLVMQRTKLYESDFEIQRGLLVGFSFNRVDFTTCLFNLGDEPTVVLGVGFSF